MFHSLITSSIRRMGILLLLALFPLLTACSPDSSPSGSSTYLMGGGIQGTALNLTTEVTTLAGTAGERGSIDDIGAAARFDDPSGITTDGTNLYVTEQGNHIIRKVVITTGEVTTLAGSGVFGFADGTGTEAQFYSPQGITTDGTNLYVADNSNNTIRQIVIATGDVTTLAGSGVFGFADGTGADAQFANPYGITTDGTNLYVGDSANCAIRQIVIATGAVTTLAGGTAIDDCGTIDGTGTAAKFDAPEGITTDGANLYVADTGNHTIRQIVIATGEVTTLAGTATLWGGFTDGTGAAAEFYYPYGITTDGVNLYVADSSNYSIRKVVIATGVVTTLAGTNSLDAIDATGTDARFHEPWGITTDGDNLYVTDVYNHTVRQID